MTPSWGDSGFKLEPKSREERKPTWPRVLVLVGLLILAFFVAKGCQDRQVRVTEAEAVASAEEAIDFEATFTQVRLLRQGINRKAYWFVSLSQPIGYSGDRPDLFANLAVVKVDARTGDVIQIQSQSEEDTKKAKAEAARRGDQDAVRQRLEQLDQQ